MPETLPVLAGSFDLEEVAAWDDHQLLGWLDLAIPAGADRVRMADDARHKIGAALHMLRLSSSDGEYGRQVKALAERHDNDVRTLSRWRTQAEKFYELPVPDKRTKAQRERQEAARKAKAAAAAEIKDLGDLGHDVLSREVVALRARVAELEASAGAPLPEPRTKADIARLGALIETVGAEAVARCWPLELVKSVNRVMIEAHRILAPPQPPVVAARRPPRSDKVQSMLKGSK